MKAADTGDVDDETAECRCKISQVVMSAGTVRSGVLQSFVSQGFAKFHSEQTVLSLFS
jgi:hypothetical protein